MRSLRKGSKSGRGTTWVCAVALVCATQPSRADTGFSPGVCVGTVTAIQIPEASGLVASRDNAGVLWTHNDSGDTARIFAINTQGQLLGTYNIMLSGTTTFATAVDFEDIAIGPGPQPELSYLYVGDIGDNSAQRANITLYRIAEPAVYGWQSVAPITKNLNQDEWQSITVLYPDGAHNAETLLADARTGDVFVCSKQGGVTRVYRAAAADLASGATVTMSFIAEVALDTSTGGDISPTGSGIIIRRYPAASMWTRTDGQGIAEALAGAAVAVPIASEPQGEAIAFDAIGSGYFTLSEGTNRPLYYYQRIGDGPIAPTTLVGAGAQWKYLDNGSDQGIAWRQPGFDDGAWTVGAAQLGYGDGDEQTVVSYGPDANNRYVTTYFRKVFQVDPALAFDSLTLKLVYDDGAAVYLNGTEIARLNLAPNAAATDFATATQYALENTWFTLAGDPNLLVPGTNTLAVEVHQVNPTSSDLSFDLQLAGATHARSVRLEVTKVNGLLGTVTLSPEPNDANAPAFAYGTVVELTAVPNEGKYFRHWEVYDPCHPNDANCATIDANNPLTIVMDTDRQVTAVFKCGSGVEQTLPLLVVGLCVLGFAAWYRRR